MTLASFRAETRGNLDRSKRVFYYLVKFKHATINIRTEELDLSSILITPYDWEESVCDKVTELIHHDVPRPKVNRNC